MTGDAAEVLSHLEGGVLTLTLNRAARKNALTEAMYRTLADALTHAATQDEVRVVVLQGQPNVFSAGNDVQDFLQSPPNHPQAPVFDFLRALATFPKPLLASVCGPAVGVGTTMLLHCDLVFAGDNALFSVPFVNLGLCPEAASSLLLPKLMGHQRASEVLLLGDPFAAEAALEIGLVNRVLPPTEVNAYAQTQAQRLAGKPTASVLATKRLLKGQTEAVLQRMEEEAALFGRMLTEPAAREAFAAFLTKG
jgi:enoyl-CoA hydratase/carnithine racemase